MTAQISEQGSGNYTDVLRVQLHILFARYFLSGRFQVCGTSAYATLL